MRGSAAAAGQRLGDVARLHAGGLGQHHRRIGRHVAMAASRGGSTVTARDRAPRAAFPASAMAQRVDHERADIGKEVHRGHLPRRV
jgi:hypothetical protein